MTLNRRNSFIDKFRTKESLLEAIQPLFIDALEQVRDLQSTNTVALELALTDINESVSELQEDVRLNVEVSTQQDRRLDRLERLLTQLDTKLDRVESILDRVHGLTQPTIQYTSLPTRTSQRKAQLRTSVVTPRPSEKPKRPRLSVELETPRPSVDLETPTTKRTKKKDRLSPPADEAIYMMADDHATVDQVLHEWYEEDKGPSVYTRDRLYGHLWRQGVKVASHYKKRKRVVKFVYGYLSNGEKALETEDFDLFKFHMYRVGDVFEDVRVAANYTLAKLIDRCLTDELKELMEEKMAAIT